MKPDLYLGFRRGARKAAVNGIVIPTHGIAVDASCIAGRGTIEANGYFSGKIEWRGVDIATGEMLFESRVYPAGTVNIAETCAIIDALCWLHQNDDHTTPVYSDSEVAIGWVNGQYHKSKMPLNEFTWEAVDTLEDGLKWLRENNPKNPVLKWETKKWGQEIPADFGRK